MPRIPKPSLDRTHPLYQKGVHLRPFKLIASHPDDWKEVTKTDSIIEELDRLEVDTKSVLYSRSPIDISVDVGGPLELPEKERYDKLFFHFAPQVWSLTVLSAQLNKKPVPGAPVELNPHLSLLRSTFFELSPSDNTVDPLDYKTAIERSIYNFVKSLPRDEFQRMRRRFSQRIARQQKRTKEGLSFLESKSSETYVMSIVLGYELEHLELDTILADKDAVVQTANFAYNYAMRKLLRRKVYGFQFFTRLCYSPAYGHYWVLLVPVPNKAVADFVKSEVVKKWLLGLGRNGFCAEPNIVEYDYESASEYLDFQIAKEGLAHTDIDKDINRIYHSN